MTWLTVAQAAEELQSSPRFVLDELRRKKLRGSKIGAGWRIHADDLATYVRSHANVSEVRGKSA